MEFKFVVSPDQHETSVRYSLVDSIAFAEAFMHQQSNLVHGFCSGFDSSSKQGYGFSHDEDRDEVYVSGISGGNYDLDMVFREEFPDYIVESQVLMLWAVFERGLSNVAMELFAIHGRPWFRLEKRPSIFRQLVDRVESVDGRKFSGDVVGFLDESVRAVRNALAHADRSIRIQHDYLQVSNRVLVKVHPEYIREILSSMEHFAMQLVAK